MTDGSATTTGRRTWAILWRIALPWAACGVIAAAAWAVSPDLPNYQDAHVESVPTGLHWAVLVPESPDAVLPPGLILVSNPRGARAGLWGLLPPGKQFGWAHYGERERDVVMPEEGFLWRSGVAPFGHGSWSEVFIGWWWLLPFPLLWSGFNLWRWVRRSQ